MQLYPFQQRTIRGINAHFEQSNVPLVVVLPTGAGKSHICAALCQGLPDGATALVATHVKEVLEQNASKIHQAWGGMGAPLGIFSASLGSRRVGRITVAGIQSIWRTPEIFGHVHTLIIDECHLINHKGSGMYNSLIHALRHINPDIRIIGLTATPYRLGGGYLHIPTDASDTGRIFGEMVEPVTIQELVTDGYLAPLRSKLTQEQIDTSGVHVRGGEFVEKELALLANADSDTRIVQEVIRLAGDTYRSWLFFGCGIEHAERQAEILRGHGVEAYPITSRTDKSQRRKLTDAFRAGELKALTNANVLTTGTDFPNLDLIALCRPTMSPGLYLQMAGRGMRLKEHIDHCQVLDFAGLVQRHGPVTHVEPPRAKGKRKGVAPTKVCKGAMSDGTPCREVLHASVMVCPVCEFEFPRQSREDMHLHDEDIMGMDGPSSETMDCARWVWAPYVRKDGKSKGLKITYQSPTGERMFQWLPTTGKGGANGRKIKDYLVRAGFPGLVDPVRRQADGVKTMNDICKVVNADGRHPRGCRYSQKGSKRFVYSPLWPITGLTSETADT